jgi:hypothetical protein
MPLVYHFGQILRPVFLCPQLHSFAPYQVAL